MNMSLWKGGAGMEDKKDAGYRKLTGYGKAAEECESGRALFLRLDPEETSLLEQKSKERGISPQAYLRKVIRTKNFVDIEVSTGDLFEICEALNVYAGSIRNFLSLTIKSNDKIRQEDVDEIKNQLSGLIKLIRSIYRKTERDREKVIRKVVRDIKAQIAIIDSENTDA